MRSPDFANALRAACASIWQQQEQTRATIQNAERVRAELRLLLQGPANPLVKQVLGNHAQAIIRLRDGSWLLAEANGFLAEYIRRISPDHEARGGETDSPTGQP